jgi:hypothetical protein
MAPLGPKLSLWEMLHFIVCYAIATVSEQYRNNPIYACGSLYESKGKGAGHGG